MFVSDVKSKKYFKNFQWNQPLYLHGLNVNFGVGFRDHEESDTDFIGWIVVKTKAFTLIELK